MNSKYPRQVAALTQTFTSSALTRFSLALIRDEVTSATAITTAAIPAYSVLTRCSPSNIAPRITATTGLTYAYVVTFGTGTCSSNHTNAVYPTNEPKVIRYATDPTELR